MEETNRKMAHSYIGVPTTVLRDKDISLESKAVLCALYDMAHIREPEQELVISAKRALEYLDIEKIEYTAALTELSFSKYAVVDFNNWDVVELL